VRAAATGRSSAEAQSADLLRRTGYTQSVCAPQRVMANGASGVALLIVAKPPEPSLPHPKYALARPPISGTHTDQAAICGLSLARGLVWPAAEQGMNTSTTQQGKQPHTPCCTTEGPP
jgi:hypothetical protein